MICRRTFIVTAGGSLLVAPLSAQAQPEAKVPRIGVLSGRPPNNDPCLDALRRGLIDLGYVEGRSHVLELRWSDGANESFLKLGSDLVARKVAVIVAFINNATVAAKQATSTIPIVMASGSFPVELGIVASLAHPGGNITGLAEFSTGVFAKRLQLLKEAVPVWPLTVGKTWEQSNRQERPVDRTTLDRNSVWTVDTDETITVPAGTFRTMKITWRNKNTGA